MPATKHLIISVGVAATTVLIAPPVGAREHCPDPLTHTEAVVAVETGIFSALKNEDKVSWERLTVRDFVAFEGGHRYGRTDFFELLRSAHAAGRHFEWNVTSPRIEVSCTLATLAYVNQGSVTRAARAQPHRGWRLRLLDMPEGSGAPFSSSQCAKLTPYPYGSARRWHRTPKQAVREASTRAPEATVPVQRHPRGHER